jgi:hypothetical protein
MSEFNLHIELGNEAMQTGTDISDALKKVAGRLWNYGDEDDIIGCRGAIMDMNGNKVGRWEVTGDTDVE